MTIEMDVDDGRSMYPDVRHAVRYMMLGALLVILIGVAVLLLHAKGASAACSYSGSGNWVVSSFESCPGQTIQVNGDLVIQSGGNLTLSANTIRMNVASDGDKKIEVQLGGTFNIRAGSVVTSTSTSLHYRFFVRSGAVIDIAGSTVSECGFGPGSDDMGMKIETGSATITGSFLVDNYVGVWFRSGSPTMTNTKAFNNRFGVIVTDGATPTITNSDIYNNGDGLVAVMASPTIQTSRVYGNGFSGIELVKSTGTIYDNEIHDNYFGILSRTSSPTIQANDILSNRDGIHSVFGDPKIDDNLISRNDRYAVCMAETGGWIRNNEITGPLGLSLDIGYGIILDSATTSVTGNNIHDHNLSAIEVHPGSDVLISNNTITNCDAHAILTRASHFIIEDNSISHAYYAINLQSDYGLIRNNTFTDNYIDVGGGYVNKSLVFDANRFSNSTLRSVSMYSSQMTMTNNTFDSNLEGVRAYDSDAYVVHNTFINNTIGMNISANSNLYFADNNVMNGNYTIFAIKSSGTLVNNTISYSSEHSIYFINHSYGLLINNTILGNEGRGVYFLDSDGDFIGNVFSQSGTGIYGVDAELRLTANTFHNNSVGVFLDSSTAYLTGDDIRDSSTYGIFGLRSELHVDSVTIERSNEGIYIEKTVLFMTGTTISNGTKGITITDGTKIEVTSSTIKDVKEAGIYAFDTTITVDLSSFINNTYGIKAYTSRPTVTNTLFDKGEEAIHLEGYILKVDGCRFSNLNSSAIKISDADDTIEDSTFIGNRNGVVQLNRDLNVERSEFLDNRDMGIQLTGTRLEVRDSRFVNNTDGVFDTGGSIINIYDCNMSANRVYGLYSANATYSSNMTYSRMMFLQDNAFLIKGTFKVVKNGNVELLRAQLDFNPVNAGEAGVIVERGGHLKVIQSLVSAHRVGVGYYFVAQDNSELVIVDSYIRDCGRGMSGTATGLTINTSANHIQGTLFENNSIGILVTNVEVNASELRFETNVIGLKALYGHVKLVNSTFNGSTEKDISMEQSTVHLVNSIISQSASKIEIGEVGCLFDVAWYVNVSVVWKDGQPVSGAQVSITETEGSVLSAKADDQGNLWWLVVREYERKGPGANAYHFYSPVIANASDQGISVEKSVEISSSLTVTLVLIDEEPPAIVITTPADGTVLYDDEVLVMGTAEDIGSIVDSVWVSQDGIVWLPANGTNSWSTHMVLAAGMRTIYAKAIDSKANIRSTNITIEVDPDSPILEVWTPEDGNVTVYGSTIVTGRVHVGSTLTLNGEDVTISRNGTFMKSMMLNEGANIITIKCLKGPEKKEVRLTVFLDTTPPPITVVSPTPASLVNNASVTVTVRSNENATFFFDDKKVESYGFEGVIVLDLKEGANKVWVRAVDKVGNENQVNFTVIVDSIKPEIVMEIPSEPITQTTDDDTVIRGRTEPGVLLMVNDKTVQVGNDGIFETTIDLGMGTNKVSIVVRDEANNTNEAQLEVKRVRKPEDMMKYMPFVLLAVIIGICMDVGTFAYYHHKKKNMPELAQEMRDQDEQAEVERAAASAGRRGEERAVRKMDDKGFYGREAKSLDQFQQRRSPPPTRSQQRYDEAPPQQRPPPVRQGQQRGQAGTTPPRQPALRERRMGARDRSGQPPREEPTRRQR